MPLRNLIAIVSTLVLTIAPAWYQYSLRNKAPVNFTALIESLESVALVPSDWERADGGYQFDDQWRQRLGLKHHWSLDAASAEGDSVSVLLMLSENGEQIYHTPEVCYEAIGCQIEEDSVSRELDEYGHYRLVQVEFPGIGDRSTGVAIWGYWTGEEWIAPRLGNVLNVMAHEPFLLKLQVLLRDEQLDSPAALEKLDDYMVFLGNRLKQLRLKEAAYEGA